MSRTVLARDPDQRLILRETVARATSHPASRRRCRVHWVSILASILRHEKNGLRPTDLSGPFGVELLSADQIQSIQRQSCPETPLEPLLFQDITHLINECTCDSVDRLANHAVVAAVAETADTVPRRHDNWLDRALPQRTAPSLCDSFLFARLGNSDDEEASLLSLNQEGLTTLVGDELGFLWTHVTGNGLARAVHFLLGEVLELARNAARNDHRSVIVPSDLRMAIFHDEALYDRLGNTKMFYPPDMWEE
jgi:hypothetical protein